MSLRVTEESLDRRILALAIPAIGSGLTALAHYWIDAYWIGRYLEEADTAALSIAWYAVWIFGALASLLSVGLTALVARYVGAGRQAGARYVGSQGIRGAVGFAVVLAAAGWFLAPSVFALAKSAPGVTAAGVPYVRYYWLGGLVFLGQQAADAIFRGHGITWIPFVLSCGALLVNAVLDPLLVLGWGPFPRLELRGAALATLVAQGAASLLAVAILRKLALTSPRRPPDDELRLRPTTPVGRPNRFGLDLSVAYRITRVGLPTACSGVFFSIIYIGLNRIVWDAGGTAAQAGLGVGLRAEALAFVIGAAFSAAAASLVGRSLGQGDPELAARSAWRATLHCTIPCALWAVFLFLGNAGLVDFLLRDGPAQAHAESFLYIISFCLVPLAVEAVLEGAFGGAGLTVPPMVVTLALTSVRLPVAAGLVYGAGQGVTAIWWTISATAICRGLLVGRWFGRGTWKTHGV